MNALSRPSIITVWLALAALSFFISRTFIPEKETPSTTASSSETVIPKKPPEELLPAHSLEKKTTGLASARLTSLDKILANASQPDLAKLYRQISELDENLLNRTSKGMVLERWIQKDRASAWSAMIAREIECYDLAKQWMYSANPVELWQRLQNEGETSQASEFTIAFFSAWLIVFPGEIDRLQNITQTTEPIIHSWRISDARMRGDIGEAVRLISLPNSEASVRYLTDVAWMKYWKHPKAAFAALEELPQHLRDPFLDDLYNFWLTNKTPAIAIEFALSGEESKTQKTRLKRLTSWHLLQDDFLIEHLPSITRGILKVSPKIKTQEARMLLERHGETNPDDLMTLLPLMNDALHDLALAIIAKNWREESLHGALDYAKKIESRYDRRLFLRNYFTGRAKLDINKLASWMANTDSRKLHLWRVRNRLANEMKNHPEKVMWLSRRLTPEDQANLRKQIIDAELDLKKPEQAAQLLNDHLEMVTPETVQTVFENWDQSEPEKAREWRDTILPR